MVYKHLSIREQQTLISGNQEIAEISLLIGSSIYACINLNKKKLSNTNLTSFYHTIKASAKGQLIPAPVWVNNILQYLKKNQYEHLYQVIIRTMDNNMIHIETVRQLRLFDL